MTKSSPDSGKRATPADHAKGHRARMRGKLLEKGTAARTELEILEMLLYAGAPRGASSQSNISKIYNSVRATLPFLGNLPRMRAHVPWDGQHA